MQKLEFYNHKRILVTGHTGFKGSWLCRVLVQAGAEVTGYALIPPTKPALFSLAGLERDMNSIIGDIRDIESLRKTITQVRPEIVLHLAAQPLVRGSYVDPVYTYETNVMGTVNLLECVRNTDTVNSLVNITTDKVYQNKEWVWGYRENDELNGYDPYSNSKSCSELVTDSYNKAFLYERGVAVSTARAGNVIGGGDFAADRIVPDCIRAAEKHETISIRNPYSVRPYQHVLEPVMAYLMIAQRQYEDRTIASAYNIGPEVQDCITTGELADLFCGSWEEQTGEKISWINHYDGGPHESGCLKLDCSKIKEAFDWKPVWHVQKAVQKTVEWTVAFKKDGRAAEGMDKQIQEYLKESVGN